MGDFGQYKFGELGVKAGVLFIVLFYSSISCNHRYYSCFRCSYLKLIQIILESEANGDCLH